MFTSKAPSDYAVSLSKKGRAPINRDFNLKEVSASHVLSSLDEIKKDPVIMLPQVLDLNRPVNAAYFEFIKDVWANRLQVDPYKSWNSVKQHMIRALLCSAHQLEMVLPELAKHNDSETIPYAFIDCLPEIGFMVVEMDKKKNLFLRTYLQIMDSIQKMLTCLLRLHSSPEFNLDILKMAESVCIILKDKTLSDDVANHMFDFVVSITQKMITADILLYVPEVVSKLTYLLENRVYIAAFSDSSIVEIVCLFGLIVKKVVAGQNEDPEFVEMWSDLIKKFIRGIVQVEKRITDERAELEFVDGVIAFMNWTISNIAPKNPPERKFTREEYHGSYDMKSMAPVKRKVMDSVQFGIRDLKSLKGFKQSVFLTDRCNELVQDIQGILQRNTNVLVTFVGRISELLRDKQNLFIQLFAVQVLVNVPADAMVQAIETIGVDPSLLINDSAWSEKVIRNTGDTISFDLYMLTQTLVVAFFSGASANVCHEYLTELSKYLQADCPAQVYGILTALRRSFLSENKVLPGVIGGHRCMSELITIDLMYKQKLLMNQAVDPLLVKNRTSFVHLLTLLSEAKEFCVLFFASERNSTYIRHLLFEDMAEKAAIMILSCGIRRCPSPEIVIGLKDLFSNIPVTEESIGILCGLLGALKVAFNENVTYVASYFIDCHMIECVLDLCLRFVSAPNQVDDVDRLVSQVLTMFLSFCRIGYLYMLEFCRPEARVQEGFQAIFQYVAVQEKHLNMFVSLTLNREATLRDKLQTQTVANPVAFNTLLSLCARSHFAGVVYEFLQRLVELSLENRWSCYSSGLFLNLIEGMDESYPPIFFSLIRTIGADFCGPKEFGYIIETLRKTDCPYSIQVLDICVGMVKGRYSCNEDQGINVESDLNRYYTAAFDLLSHFKLSFSVSFDTVKETPLIVISSAHETITITSGASLRIEYIRTPHFTEAVVKSHPKRIKAKRVYNIEFSYSPSLMILKVNKRIFEYRLEEAFEMTSSPVRFKVPCRSEKWISIESILITEIPAKSLLYSLSVRFPFGFRDVLAIGGGAKCLLAFLDKLSDSVDPPKFLSLVLELIFLMLDKDPGIDKLFIRSLSHLLGTIKQEYWTENTMSLLGAMVRNIKEPQIHQCYSYNILLNFGWWVSNPIDRIRLILFQNVIEAYRASPALFKSSISFSELITRYYKFSTCFTESPSLTAEITQFLLKFANESFTRNDAHVLVAFFLQTKDIVFAEISGEIIYRLLSKGNSILASFIISKGYMYLMTLAGSISDTVRNWALHIVFVLFKNAGVDQSEALQIGVLEMISMLSHKAGDLSMVSMFFGFIFDAIEIGQDGKPTESIRREDTRPLVFVEYTPLFLVLLAELEIRDAQVYVTTFFRSIQLFSESRVAILRLNYWYFWLLFMGIRYNYVGESIKVIGYVAGETLKKGDNSTVVKFYNFLFYVFSIYDLDWEKHIPSFFNALISKGVQNSVLRYILLFLHIHVEFGAHRRTWTDIELMSFYADLFVSASPIDATFTGREESGKLDERTGLLLVQSVVTAMLHESGNLLEPVQLDGTAEYPRILLLSVIIGHLASLDQELCDSAVAELLTTMKKMEFTQPVKNSLLTMYSISTLSEPYRTSILRMLKEKLLPAEAQKIDEMAGDLRLLIKSRMESLMSIVIEELAVKSKQVAEMGQWLSHMLHVDDIVDLSLATEALLSADMATRDAKDALNAKQNEKSWMSLQTSLAEGGGLWSTLVVPEHWEVSPVVDAQGRKYLMKINRHFCDHKDAALKRDAQNVVETRTATLPPVLTPRTKAENDTASFDCEARLVTVKGIYEGSLQVFNGYLAFESRKGVPFCSPTPLDTNKLEEIDLCDILFILKRRYLHQDNACELFARNRKSYFFVFLGGERNWFLKSLARQKMPFYIQTDTPQKVLKDFDIVRLWQSGKMTNYEYLYWLNMIGGRSFHDLSQYPVYPWVLKQYTEPTLDLNDPESYRDLSRPVGTLNAQRLEELKSLFDEMEGDPLRCHLRVFYSSPAIVVNYLIRCEPFTTCHIDLQSGAFDHASRLVNSIPAAWRSVTSARPDFRELIPEFFTLPSMLVNANGFDLGLPDSDMELPPWASCADDFIFLNRVALESRTVSQSLNGWVDLIFGYKSRGKEAVQSYNDYHPFSYPDCLANRAQFNEMGNMIEDHAANFGVVPQQLFTEPSPKKTIRAMSGLDSGLVFSMSQGKISRILGKISKGIVVLVQRDLYVVSLKERELKVLQKLEGPARFNLSFALNSLVEQVPETEMLVAVSPWANNFALFDVSSKLTFLEAGSRHPGVVHAVCVDAGVEMPTRDLYVTVGTVSQDCSFFIWRARVRDGKCSDIRRVSSMVHHVEIIDIAISMNADIVATVDKLPQLVLTRLSTGHFYRSLALTRIPYQVEMTAHGYIVLVSKMSGTTGVSVDVLNLNCEILCTKDFEGDVCSVVLINARTSDPSLVIVLRSRQLILVRLFRLTETGTVELPGVPASAFADSGPFVWICYEDGSISHVQV